MKVVLFCGGLGLRLRGYAEDVPKPMVHVGNHPIIWHLMRYYTHFGHREFILCLGYQADYIKRYFLNHCKCIDDEFAPTGDVAHVDLPSSDKPDWRITFADTGLHTNIGGRLRAVREQLRGEDVFLANYTDNLSDADLQRMTEEFLDSDAVAAFLRVKPNFTFHLVQTDDRQRVRNIESAANADLWSNGGFFIFRQEIFDYLQEGDELVEQPFQRLIQEGKLVAYQHDGFWACMDTFKEKQQLDDLYLEGKPPWHVWKRTNRAATDQLGS